MRVEHTFFANAAVSHPDGSWSALNGGVDTIGAVAFPAVQPTLSFVLRLSWGPDEHPGDHVPFRFEMIGPDGRQAMPPGDVLALKLNAPEPGRRPVLTVVLNMGGLVFEAEGEYQMRVVVNETPLDPIALRVVLVAGGTNERTD